MFDDCNWQRLREAVHLFLMRRDKKFLEDFCKEAGLKEPIAYDYTYGQGFTIYTNRPGVLIGKHGNVIKKYSQRLREEFGENEKINLVEIRNGGFVNY